MTWAGKTNYQHINVISIRLGRIWLLLLWQQKHVYSKTIIIIMCTTSSDWLFPWQGLNNDDRRCVSVCARHVFTQLQVDTHTHTHTHKCTLNCINFNKAVPHSLALFSIRTLIYSHFEKENFMTTFSRAVLNVTNHFIMKVNLYASLH